MTILNGFHKPNTRTTYAYVSLRLVAFHKILKSKEELYLTSRNNPTRHNAD